MLLRVNCEREEKRVLLSSLCLRLFPCLLFLFFCPTPCFSSFFRSPFFPWRGPSSFPVTHTSFYREQSRSKFGDDLVVVVVVVVFVRHPLKRSSFESSSGFRELYPISRIIPNFENCTQFREIYSISRILPNLENFPKFRHFSAYASGLECTLCILLWLVLFLSFRAAEPVLRRDVRKEQPFVPPSSHFCRSCSGKESASREPFFPRLHRNISAIEMD